MGALQAWDERQYSDPELEGPHAPTTSMLTVVGAGVPLRRKPAHCAFLFAFGGTPSPPPPIGLRSNSPEVEVRGVGGGDRLGSAGEPEPTP